jgi:hypothetical protein
MMMKLIYLLVILLENVHGNPVVKSYSLYNIKMNVSFSI